MAVSREFDLVLNAAAVATPSSLEAVRHCAESAPDWDVILELARKHGVAPLVIATLRSSCWSSVPELHRAKFDRLATAITHRNAAICFEMVQILGKFREARVRAASFKGPVLAQCLYGDLGLREFLDIDIIVPRPDLPRAEQILMEFGYHTRAHEDGLREFYRAAGQFPFRNPSSGIVIDLHWEFTPFGRSFPFDAEDIWAAHLDVTLARQPVPTLSWEQLALYLAFHGTKERWRLLKWVCDFAQLMRSRPDLDWSSIYSQARARNCSRPLLLGIFLAAELLGADADVSLLQTARSDRDVRTLADESIRMLKSNHPETQLTKFRYALTSIERTRDKISMSATLATTLTVSDYESVSVPKGLNGLHYVTRIFRIALKILRQTLRPAR